MTRDEIQLKRELAVFAFLTENEGAVLVSEKYNSAIIRTGGLTAAQVRMHGLLTMATLGLWLPVFFAVVVLRTPRLVELRVNDDGAQVVTTL